MLCVSECFASMHICTPHMSSAHGGQNRVLDPLELELLTVTSQCTDAGNRILVLCRNTSALTIGPSSLQFCHLYIPRKMCTAVATKQRQQICPQHPSSPSHLKLPTLKLLSSDTEIRVCACQGQNSTAVTEPRWPFSSTSTDCFYEDLYKRLLVEFSTMIDIMKS